MGGAAQSSPRIKPSANLQWTTANAIIRLLLGDQNKQKIRRQWQWWSTRRPHSQYLVDQTASVWVTDTQASLASGRCSATVRERFASKRPLGSLVSAPSRHPSERIPSRRETVSSSTRSLPELAALQIETLFLMLICRRWGRLHALSSAARLWLVLACPRLHSSVIMLLKHVSLRFARVVIGRTFDCSICAA
jgi:hypothetical protein